jgi:DNA-binding HxlR family transcriptional regulator
LAKTINTQRAIVARFDEASIACPFGKLLEGLGKPHTLEILYGLGIRSPLRFTQIQKGLDLQPKTLTARLQELAKLGLVARKSYNEIPPRVDYELTQKGRDLGKMFDELQAWAGKYDYIEQPRGRTKAVKRVS